MRTMTRRAPLAAALAVVAAVSAATVVPAQADGTETLGAPSIAIADGTGVASGGIGLTDGQPGDIVLAVPADATVNQVLLYWEGQHLSGLGDDTIEVEGTEVVGDLIGGPTLFFSNIYSSTYRADITSLSVVQPGGNAVTVGGLNFARNNGAGILAIYSSPSEPEAEVGLVDGNDLAFRDFAPTLDTTVPQTFTFAASDTGRSVPLTLLASSVEDARYRPNLVVVESGGSTQNFLDPFANNNGAEWDAVTLAVTIPAGATSLTVQALSDDHGTGGFPASFAWSAAALVVPRDTPPPPDGCTRTQGYWKTHSDKGPARPADPTWDLLGPSGEDTTFFSSGKSYYQALWTPPKGNVYWILAHQYIAAELNALAGTTVPADVQAALDAAETFFSTYTPSSVPKQAKAAAIALAELLDDYNNGLSGPSHCGDAVIDPR
jgi:hypothetical protein